LIRGLIKKLPLESLKDAGIYTIGNLVNRAIPIILLPILIRVLDTAEYGIVSLFFGLVAVLTPLIGLSGNSVLSQKYFKVAEEDRHRLNNTSLRMIFYGATILVAPVIGLAWLLPGLFGLSVWMTLVAFGVAVMNMVITIGKNVTQLENRPMAYSLLQIAITAIDVVLSIMLVVWLGFKAEGRIVGIIIASFLGCATAMTIMVKGRHISRELFRDKSRDKEFFVAGIVLVPMSLGGWIYSLGDRFLISGMLDNSQVGLYSAALSFTTILDMVTTPVALVWAPYFFRMMNRDDPRARARAKKVTLFIIAGYVACAFLFSWPMVFVADIILGKGYTASIGLIPQLIFGNLFRSIAGLLSYYVLHEEKNHYLTIQFLLVSGIHIVAVLIGIKTAGVVGVSLGYMASGFASLALMFVALLLSQRKN
jgi:O-antigen/teichoic acid export membrane protein